MIAEVIQKVQLVADDFTPSEAKDVLNTLIEEKIKFYKVKRLSKTECNELDACDYEEQRIENLKEEKEMTKHLINEAKAMGYKLRINGTLEIELVKY